MYHRFIDVVLNHRIKYVADVVGDKYGVVDEIPVYARRESAQHLIGVHSAYDSAGFGQLFRGADQYFLAPFEPADVGPFHRIFHVAQTGNGVQPEFEPLPKPFLDGPYERVDAVTTYDGDFRPLTARG